MKDRVKILIVEDDGINQLYVKSILEDKYDIYPAYSAEEALKQLEAIDADIILMDISLKGGMTGIDLTKKLRTIPKYSSTPIIAVTGHAFPEDKRRTLEAGCSAYLAKPFEDKELVKIIESYF